MKVQAIVLVYELIKLSGLLPPCNSPGCYIMVHIPFPLRHRECHYSRAKYNTHTSLCVTALRNLLRIPVCLTFDAGGQLRHQGGAVRRESPFEQGQARQNS